MNQSSYSLSLFEYIAFKRRPYFLWVTIILLVMGIISIFLSFIPIIIKILLWLLTAASASLYIYYYFFYPKSKLVLGSNHLEINSPIQSIKIPYTLISNIYRASLQEYYAIDTLSAYELSIIEQIYEEHALLIELKSVPPSLGLNKLPQFLRTPENNQFPGLILNVSDWAELRTNLQKKLKGKKKKEKPKSTVAPPTPVVTPTAPPLSHIQSSPQSKPYIMPTKEAKVLIVEDNDQIRLVLKSMLNPYYQVISASDGVEGLRLAKEESPDIILTDLMMPIMSGRELLSAIRNNKQLQRIPVIFLTAESDMDTQIHVLEMGADDYLTKPFNESELLIRTKNHLKSYLQEKELSRLNWQLESKIEDQMAELVRRGDLIRFLPDSVAKNVMSGQIGPTAKFERRYVTILFVDIVGFTTITDKLQPSVLASFLNEYLREMTAVTIVHNGTVDKFIGDAVMVLFGAPEKQDPREQAINAIETAMAMQKQIAQMARNWKSTIPYQISIRIGINTGECTIGVFGSDLLKSYTAVGSTVNIASRLQGQAPIGGVICGPITFKLVRHLVHARPLKPLTLKGVSRPVPAFLIDKLRDKKENAN